MFDCEVNGGIWLIHLQRTTASKFFENFNQATLIAGCLRSRMKSTNTVCLVLALTCFGPSLISPHKNLILRDVSGSFSRVTSPHFNRRLSSRALNPKWRAVIHHKVRCKIVGFEVPNSPHSKTCLPRPLSAHRQLVVCSLCHVLRQVNCRRLALKTSLESLKFPSVIFTFEPLSFKEHWRLRWKDVKLSGLYSVMSDFFKLLKNLHNSKFNSSSGMSDSSLFLFSCKQNRFHAFMSLSVLTFVFAGFCCKTNSWNSSTFLFSLFSFSLTHSVSSFSNSIDTETTGNLLLSQKRFFSGQITKQNFDEPAPEKFFLQDKARNPERARSLHLARSGSQSQHGIWFILPAHGATHIISMGYWPSEGSRWLDIGQVLFLRVYGRSQGV